MRAVFLKDYPPKDDLKAVHWRLYQCDPGGCLPPFVIVSASNVAAAETRIFAADQDGKVTTSFSAWLWHESDTLDHEQTLRAAGYEPEGYPK